MKSTAAFIMLLEWFRSHLANAPTTNDLKTLHEELIMKLSEIKAAVSQLKKDNAEALGEINTLVASLNQKIADLIAGNTDPEVTDAEFLADLNAAQADAKKLAAIVSPTEPVPPSV